MTKSANITAINFRMLSVAPEAQRFRQVSVLTSTELYELQAPQLTILSAIKKSGDTFEAVKTIVDASTSIEAYKLSNIRTILRRDEASEKNGHVYMVEIDTGRRVFGMKFRFRAQFREQAKEQEFVDAVQQASGWKYVERLERTKLWDAVNPPFLVSLFVLPMCGAILLSALSESDDQPRLRGRKMRAMGWIGNLIGPVGAVAIAVVVLLGLIGWAVYEASKRGHQRLARPTT